MQKRRVLSLILAVLLFLTTSPMDVRAAGGGAWEWENENNYEGWSHNNQIDATCVADGWYTLHIPGTEDPNIPTEIKPAIQMHDSIGAVAVRVFLKARLLTL